MQGACIQQVVYFVAPTSLRSYTYFGVVPPPIYAILSYLVAPFVLCPFLPILARKNRATLMATAMPWANV